MIRTTIVASVVVIAGYTAFFWQTQTAWTAMNAAGVIASVGLLVLVWQFLRRPMKPLVRTLILVGSLVVIAGTAYHWIIMYRMSHFQYNTLHLVHKVIVHGISLDILRDQGIRTLQRYNDNANRTGSIAEIFRRNADLVKSDSGYTEVRTDSEVRVILASESDSEVVLIALAKIRVDGEDPSFRNFDGGTGAVQDRLIIGRKGLVYDIQN